jgi:hypothetical protein
MGFDPEPRGYLKTILSDLQGAWECLRREVADNPGYPSPVDSGGQLQRLRPGGAALEAAG